MKISEAAQEVLEKLWVETVDKGADPGDLKEIATESVVKELIKAKHIICSDNKARLTPEGREEARGIIRRHRLAERLLHDVLDVGGEDMEDSACGLEHILSEGVEESICILLGHPTECPHGRPIPPGKCCREGREMAERVISPLSELGKGRRGKIAYIHTKNHSNLPKLLAMGILPGTPVEVIQTFPSYVFQVGQTQVAVDAEIANEIFVRSI